MTQKKRRDARYKQAGSSDPTPNIQFSNPQLHTSELMYIHSMGPREAWEESYHSLLP